MTNEEAPNYESYSLRELLEARAYIDARAHPARARRIEQEIARRNESHANKPTAPPRPGWYGRRGWPMIVGVLGLIVGLKGAADHMNFIAYPFAAVADEEHVAIVEGALKNTSDGLAKVFLTGFRNALDPPRTYRWYVFSFSVLGIGVCVAYMLGAVRLARRQASGLRLFINSSILSVFIRFAGAVGVVLGLGFPWTVAVMLGVAPVLMDLLLLGAALAGDRSALVGSSIQRAI